MNLPYDDILKRKDSKEASDSGLLLWQHNFSAFILFFAVPFLLFAVFLRVVLPENLWFLSWLIVWLLKPLFDRLILHVISIRFFEKDADIKSMLRGLVKNILRGLAGDLLWRRFSPLRSAMMPVRVLERNIKTADKFSQRRKNLEKGGIGFCIFLTVWGLAVEAALLAGEILFFLTMSEFISKEIVYSINGFFDIEIFIYTAWCLNFILVETVYICMGFSLYINSRVDIEGWDIEIIFRGLAEKLKNTKIIAVFALSLTFLFFPVKASADEITPDFSGDTPMSILKTILDSPDFGGVEESWGIRFKNQDNETEAPAADIEQFQQYQRFFAYVLRLTLISLIAGLAVVLLFYLRRIKWNKKENDSYSAEKLTQINPDDTKQLLEKAAAFYKQGETRLAWGYCACAAVKSVSFCRDIIFPLHATEYDCMQIAGSRIKNSAEADSFEKIMKNWIYLAYAGRLPPEGSFEEALGFCRSLGTQNE